MIIGKVKCLVTSNSRKMYPVSRSGVLFMRQHLAFYWQFSQAWKMLHPNSKLHQNIPTFGWVPCILWTQMSNGWDQWITLVISKCSKITFDFVETAHLWSMFPDPVQGRTFPGLLGNSLFHLVKTNQAGRCLTAWWQAALGHTCPLDHFLTSLSPGCRLLSGQLAQGGTRVSEGLSEYVWTQGLSCSALVPQGFFTYKIFQNCCNLSHTSVSMIFKYKSRPPDILH